MSVTCPHGHVSQTADYCDECGAPIAGASAPPLPILTAELDVLDEDTSATAIPEPCPACGTARSGADRYCEACGHDFLAPPRAAAAWTAVVRADPARFDRPGVSGLAAPGAAVERRSPLDGDRVRIGRGRAGGAVPDIDLDGATGDPGVSRAHAVLERGSDGRWVVRDVGSTNGTTVNDDPTPLAADVAVALTDGDVIRVGAWTTITVVETPRGP